MYLFWRRGRDSNPRYRCRHDGFQDRYLQPLGHLSICILSTINILPDNLLFVDTKWLISNNSTFYISKARIL